MNYGIFVNSFFLPYCTRTSGTMLNRSNHKENSCLELNLKGKTSITSPFSLIVCIRIFVDIKEILYNPNFLRFSPHGRVLNFIK